MTKNFNLTIIGENLVLGDMLCLAGAILYGVSNVVQEYLVKQGSSIEFLALMGLWATVVGGIQMLDFPSFFFCFF